MKKKIGEFQVFAHKYSIYEDTELLHTDDCMGMTSFRDRKITLQPSCEGYPRKEEDVSQTLAHEMIHVMLHHAGEKELCLNEQLVDLLAAILNQITISSKKIDETIENEA